MFVISYPILFAMHHNAQLHAARCQFLYTQLHNQILYIYTIAQLNIAKYTIRCCTFIQYRIEYCALSIALSNKAKLNILQRNKAC